MLEERIREPMAERLVAGDCDQLHHFIAAGVWNAGPVEEELFVQADRLVGGSDAVPTRSLRRKRRRTARRLAEMRRLLEAMRDLNQTPFAPRPA